MSVINVTPIDVNGIQNLNQSTGDVQKKKWIVKWKYCHLELAVDLSVNCLLKWFVWSITVICGLQNHKKKEAKVFRGGGFECICTTWHVDLLLSCRKIHINLYIVENHSKTCCWATINQSSDYQGFPLIPVYLFSRQSPWLLFFSVLISQTEYQVMSVSQKP